MVLSGDGLCEATALREDAARAKLFVRYTLLALDSMGSILVRCYAILPSITPPRGSPRPFASEAELNLNVGFRASSLKPHALATVASKKAPPALARTRFKLFLFRHSSRISGEACNRRRHRMGVYSPVAEKERALAASYPPIDESRDPPLLQPSMRSQHMCLVLSIPVWRAL